MKRLYDFLISLFNSIFLPVAAQFSSKLKLFYEGRKNVFDYLAKQNLEQKKIIWFHVASLGEYEQGLPIMKEVKSNHPEFSILVSFFSPSGYEVKKNNSIADSVCYLPLDTPKNAKRFIELVNPSLAVFVKYEIWPNFLLQLQQKEIPSVLIAATFRENQIYFKSYGKFLWKALKSFQHIFLQNEASANVLKANDIQHYSVSGDTRYDRVLYQTSIDNRLGFMDEFTNQELCLVCGSTWPEDEAMLIEFINSTEHQLKIVIAPHQINQQHVEKLQQQIKLKTAKYSSLENQNLKEVDVLLIDTIGLLTKIYSYADMAYVGGAAGNTGLHNILEPAVFGIPVLFGKNHDKFPEAEELINAGGATSVNNTNQLVSTFNSLISDQKERLKMGNNSKLFIENKKGATPKVYNYLKNNFLIT